MAGRQRLYWPVYLGGSDYTIESEFWVEGSRQGRGSELCFFFLTAANEMKSVGLDGAEHQLFLAGGNWAGANNLLPTPLEPGQWQTLRLVRSGGHTLGVFLNGKPLRGMETLLLKEEVRCIGWSPHRAVLRVKSMRRILTANPYDDGTQGGDMWSYPWRLAVQSTRATLPEASFSVAESGVPGLDGCYHPRGCREDKKIWVSEKGASVKFLTDSTGDAAWRWLDALGRMVYKCPEARSDRPPGTGWLSGNFKSGGCRAGGLPPPATHA